MEVIRSIAHAMGSVFGAFFISDMDVMSPEARKILSNHDDRKKYIDAVDQLRKDPTQPQTIILSTQEEITLVS